MNSSLIKLFRFVSFDWMINGWVEPVVQQKNVLVVTKDKWILIMRLKFRSHAPNINNNHWNVNDWRQIVIFFQLYSFVLIFIDKSDKRLILNPSKWIRYSENVSDRWISRLITWYFLNLSVLLTMKRNNIYNRKFENDRGPETLVMFFLYSSMRWLRSRSNLNDNRTNSCDAITVIWVKSFL